MKKLLLILIALSFGCMSVWAQTRSISGQVVSTEDGMPVPGVSIVLKGTTLGAVTDVDGNFTLKVNREQGVLVFSFVGMKNLEVALTSSDVYNVKLSPETLGLDEVLVVGFGSKIKSELTGAIAKVDVEGLQRMSDPSFETSMQGKTSGVFIQQSTGKLGEGINIRVRGSSSLSASNQPLYVVDGVIVTSQDMGNPGNHPTNPISDINMDDIESIQILKDASASAIYGSRASNGVVIITTKSGKQGQKTNINFNYSTSMSKETNRLEMLNTAEYIELIGESMDNSQWALDEGKTGAETIVGENWADLGGEKNVDTDWQDYMFRKAYSSTYNLNASGGNEKTSYYAGISYSDQEGIMINNDFDRISGRLNFDHKVNDYFEFGMKMNFVRSTLKRVADDNAFATPMQLIAQAPFFPAYNGDGTPFAGTFYFNSLLAKEYNKNETLVYRQFANAYVKVNLMKELSFRSVFGMDNLNQREDEYWGRLTDDGMPAGKAYLRQVNMLNWTFDNYFSYSKELAEGHVLDATLGMSMQRADQFVSRVGGKTFPSDYFQTLGSAAENDDYFSSKEAYSYLSYFSRLEYKLKEKYLATASYRIDGSSKFGKDSRYGSFYSGSLGWIVTKEDFMADKSAISFLKLRASYGVTGNSEIANYASRGLYAGTRYTSNSAIFPMQLENPNLKWENTGQLDVGVDFGFFDNRISGEIDYYQKTTTDLLLNRLLPFTTGFASITENVGELQNRGVEFSLNTNNFVGKFKWNTAFNISFNRNKVNKLIAPMTYEISRVEEGQPIGVFYTKKYAGVDPDNGDALYYVKAGSEEKTNNYNEAEDQIVGDPNPDFFGGLENTLSYKNFDLRVFLQFVYGNEIYNNAGRFMSANGDWVDNQTRDQLNRWKKAGDITDVPQARFGDSNGTRTSSRWISDGSYLRLKDITLGYNLPKKWTNTVYVKSARIAFSAQNLLTFTNYKGWDPEVSAPDVKGTATDYTFMNVQKGIDYYSTPQARTYMFSLNLNF